MSYCRFSEGDVYMYPDSFGAIICCGCNLLRAITSSVFWTPEEALEHLEEHRKAGHTVPERAFNRLRKEIEEEEVSNGIQSR